MLDLLPMIGDKAKSSLESLRDGLKATFKEGMLFEQMGFRYFGPVDGHDLHGLRKTLKDIKSLKGPVLSACVHRQRAWRAAGGR